MAVNSISGSNTDRTKLIWWLIGYFFIITLIFIFLFKVHEKPPTDFPNQAPVFLDLLVADNYLTRQDRKAVLKPRTPPKSINEILVGEYGIPDSIIRAYSSSRAETEKGSFLQSLIQDEVRKVTEEIKQRLGNIDTWFHYKFVLLGGVFFVLAGRLNKAFDFAHPWQGEAQTPVADGKELSDERELQRFLNSQAAHCVLGLGCIIALTVDMHIRHELDAIMTLGNWLAYYAEPALSGMEFQGDNKGQFLFWENFLRAQGEQNESVLGKYLHHMPHLFFLTWVLYALYVWTFQNIVCAGGSEPIPTAVVGTFVIINVTFLVFGYLASKITYMPLYLAGMLVVINISFAMVLRRHSKDVRIKESPHRSTSTAESAA